MTLSADLNPIHPLDPPPAPKTAGQKKLYKACQDFEGVMLGLVFKEMRKSVQSSDPLDQGQAQDIYHGMLDDAMSKSMATTGGIGLAEDLYRQLYTTVK
ncbi:MAG TPA: rod-binding protein [Oscillatoriaceae cyanobacterium]